MENIKILSKKLLLLNLSDNGYNLDQLLLEMINNIMLLDSSLSNYYDCKNIGIEFFIAYMQLGFNNLYLKNIIKKLSKNTKYETLDFDYSTVRCEQISVKKTNLNAVLGRWPISSHNSHNKLNAVNDIMNHVLCNEIGVYDYFTATNSCIYLSYFKLYVFESHSLLINLLQNKYYVLTK